MRDLILFRVGSAQFAAPLTSVEEAIDLDPALVQSVPGENPMLRGVFPLRGSLVPLYDPRRALGTAPATGGTAMVVRPVGGGSRAAIVVDDVEDVLNEVPDEDIRPPSGGSDVDGIVRGVVQRDASLIIIVDLYALVVACRATEKGDRA